MATSSPPHVEVVPAKYRWMPATPAQKMALDCEADLLFFGGSAGSLKTATICADAVQEYQCPDLRALITRESYPNLLDVIDKTQNMYRPLGAQFNEQKKIWTFPSGATVRLGYLARDADVYEYWGHEFSYIGNDESTRHTEFQLRTLISRLRSTNPRLKKRVRWGSNPGGPGAGFHQEIFLFGRCPIHQPDVSAIPGQVYNDRYWPSDHKRIPLSTAFIPGHLRDHTLLGSDYVELLRMQSGALAEQLEEGCWCQLQGAYFSFLNRGHLVPLAKVQEEWWHPHFISIDYGYGKSYAAAGLYVRGLAEEGFPNGRVRKIGELVVPHMPAFEFAAEVAKEFVEPEVNGQRRKIVAAFLDPANFSPNYDRRVGGGHSVADQIHEVLKAYDISCTEAANDRIGGWQFLYRILSSGEFEIADNCPQTFDALRTRVHDEKKPGDIMKIPGDKGDDISDETRYAIYTFINAAKKPLEIEISEAMRAAPTPTDAMITRLKLQSEMGKKNAPVFMGGRASQRRARYQQGLQSRKLR